MAEFPAGFSMDEKRPDPAAVIVTPAGSTILPVRDGGYRVCDRTHRCRRAESLWQAQQMVQWAEVHHLHLDSPELPLL
jgi:hypothetical protein